MSNPASPPPGEHVGIFPKRILRVVNRRGWGHELLKGRRKHLQESRFLYSNKSYTARWLEKIVQEAKKKNGELLGTVEHWGAISVEGKTVGELGIYMDISRRLKSEKSVFAEERKSWFRLLSSAGADRYRRFATARGE